MGKLQSLLDKYYGPEEEEQQPSLSGLLDKYYGPEQEPKSFYERTLARYERPEEGIPPHLGMPLPPRVAAFTSGLTRELLSLGLAPPAEVERKYPTAGGLGAAAGMTASMVAPTGPMRTVLGGVARRVTAPLLGRAATRGARMGIEAATRAGLAAGVTGARQYAQTGRVNPIDVLANAATAAVSAAPEYAVTPGAWNFLAQVLTDMGADAAIDHIRRAFGEKGIPPVISAEWLAREVPQLIPSFTYAARDITRAGQAELRMRQMPGRMALPEARPEVRPMEEILRPEEAVRPEELRQHKAVAREPLSPEELQWLLHSLPEELGASPRPEELRIPETLPQRAPERAEMPLEAPIREEARVEVRPTPEATPAAPVTRESLTDVARGVGLAEIPRSGTPDYMRYWNALNEQQQEAELAWRPGREAAGPEPVVQAAPWIARVRRDLLPAGWEMVRGRVATEEGRTVEAEVDWPNRRLVFADEASMQNPDIANHEIAHVMVEELAARENLLQDYIEAKKDTPGWRKYGVDWIVRNQFHREEIGVDLGEYLVDPHRTDVRLKDLFDRYFPKIVGREAAGPEPAERAEDVDSFIENRYQEYVEATRPQPGMTVREVRRARPPEPKLPEVENQEIRDMLDASVRPQNLLQAARQRGGKILNDARRLLVYEHAHRKDFPKFVNDLRLFQDTGIDVAEKATRAIQGVKGHLGKNEYRLFRQIIGLTSVRDMAAEGKPVPRGIAFEDLEAELNNITSKAPPIVLEAVENHWNLMRLVGQDLIRRGKLTVPKEPPEGYKGPLREHYYPHQVLDYLPPWMDWVGVPKRFKQPFRPYTKERVGSVRDIDMNYDRVMETHLARVFMDNAVDDFMRDKITEYDVLPKLSKEQKQATFGASARPEPGHLYDIEGERYRAWQFTPGNQWYPTLTVNEQLMKAAAAQGASLKEFAAMKGPRGGLAIREGVAVGRPKKVYLLPEPIAQRLLQFRTPAGDIPLLFDLIGWTSTWKRVILDLAGWPFQVNNFFGDAINLYKTDPVAFRKVGQAARLILSKPEKLTPAERELMQLAREQRVDTTFFMREAGVQVGAMRRRDWFNPLAWMEQISSKRERILRLSKFLEDMKRIGRGDAVVSGEIDVGGLEDVAAAGKVAREFTVDYGAVSPAYRRFLRGALTPFITFYDHNARNWVRYAANNPGDLTVKIGVPIAAMILWNNTGKRREIEENLPEYWRYLPHIITGYNTKEDKPIIVAFQTPVDMAASWFGMDRIPQKITEIRAGRMTVEQAAKEQLKDTGLGGPRQLSRLLHPMMQGMIGLMTNRDPYTKWTVVADKYKGTPDERKLQAEYLVGEIFTPYAQYVRATQTLDPASAIGKWFASRFLDVKRAFGIREIDLEAAKRRLAKQTQRTLEAKSRTQGVQIEKAYVKWQTTGDDSSFRKAIEAWQKEPYLSATQIQNRVTSPSVQMDIAKALQKKAQTEDEKEALEQEVLRLRKAFAVEGFKTTPKAIRPYVIEELQARGVELAPEQQREIQQRVQRDLLRQMASGPEGYRQGWEQLKALGVQDVFPTARSRKDIDAMVRRYKAEPETFEEIVGQIELNDAQEQIIDMMVQGQIQDAWALIRQRGGLRKVFAGSNIKSRQGLENEVQRRKAYRKAG